MANIYVLWRNFKNESLIGGALLYTELILAEKQTQVKFSGIIPLVHQHFCRYCQYSSNEQKSDCLFIYMQVHNQERFKVGEVSWNFRALR